MSINHQTLEFQGGPIVPDSDKDLYRSTDWIRDFAFQWLQAGRSMKDLLNNFPLLIHGGLVTEGASVTQIDITPAVGFAAHTVKTPDDYTSSPPDVSDQTFEGVHVESTQQTNLSLGSATLNGVAVNYVKLSYSETGSLTRARLKGSGTYVYEKNESFTITVDTTAATNFDIVLAEIVGDGSTYLTITQKNNSNLGKLFLDSIFRDDEEKTTAIPAGFTLYPFNSNSLLSDGGVGPQYASCICYLPSPDSNTKYTDRGVMETNGDCHLVYAYEFANTGTIRMRIKPKFDYNSGNIEGIFDNAEQTDLTDNVIFLRYNGNTNQYQVKFRDDSATPNEIEVLSDAYTSNGQLQVWTDIVLTWDTGTNDARLYINGVEMDGVSDGTRTVSGTGITNMTLLNRDTFSLASRDIKGTRWDQPVLMYFTELMISNSFSTDLTNYDGTTPQPYEPTNPTIRGVNNQFTQDDGGNISAKTQSHGALDYGIGLERRAELAIGPWNMDSVSLVTLDYPFGVTHDNIISVEIWIYRDDGTNKYPINYHPGTTLRGGSFILGVSDFNITRSGGGHFDDPDFDDDTINRGFVIFTYRADQ